MLQTDASAVGLVAILEQGSQVNAFASYTLKQCQTAIQPNREITSGSSLRKSSFCHYLLGRSFQLLTDHVLLQCLLAQKMEGLLCHWALTMQENSFPIVYRKGSLHANTDALSGSPLHTSSKSAAMTSIYFKPHRPYERCSTVRSCIPVNLLSSPDKPPKDPSLH